MRKRKIMSSIGLPEFYYDEEFWVRTRDGVKIDCVVEDANMLDSDTMELHIYADASDKFVSEIQLKILIEMWFETQCEICEVDYSVDVTSVNKYFDYDLDEYSGVCVGFNVSVEISNNQNDDSYFNASRKLGNKTIKSSKYVRCTSSSYDTKLIAKYVKETYDDSASARIRSFGNMSNAERYMNRNSLIYDSKNKLILFRDLETKETTPIFKVIPQHSNIKKYGMYAPKEPILEPVDSCDSVMSSYSASSKIRRGRKVLSAIDLGKKQRFVDAYMNAYGVTKSDALQIFRDCTNRGDDSYIDEIIRGFGSNAKKSFYED